MSTICRFMALIYFYILILIGFLLSVILYFNLRKSVNKYSKTEPATDLTQYKGKIGESQVHNILMNLPDDFIILDDVVLLTNNGTTSQIDHIVVSKYGIFAIETKNYRGIIYGQDNQEEWTQVIPTHVNYRSKPFKTYTYITKNKFYNPVKQSIGHTYAIKSKLKAWKYLPVIPVVCFIGNTNISNIHSAYHVVNGLGLLNIFSEYKEYGAIYLQPEDVKEIARLLTENNIVNEVSMKNHINNIHATIQDKENKINAGICPKCGSTLIRKHGQYGPFLGCSNYPTCTFRKTIH